MNKRLFVCAAAGAVGFLASSTGSLHRAAWSEPAASAGASATAAAPLQPVKGTVLGKPFEAKVALAFHRWRGGKKNVEIYDVPMTCARASAPSAADRATELRAVNMVVRWQTGEHVSATQRSSGIGGFNTYGPGSLVGVTPFSAVEVNVIDGGSASAPGRVRFRALGANSAIEGEVAVTLCPPSGKPPTECLLDEECADGFFCRRDKKKGRATKLGNGSMMGTFDDLGRCVPASPAR